MVDPIMSDHLTQLMLRLKKELQPDLRGGDARSGPAAPRGGQRGVSQQGQNRFFWPAGGLYKSKDPDIQDFLELDKVIRGTTLGEDDPFRKGLGGVANE